MLWGQMTHRLWRPQVHEWIERIPGAYRYRLALAMALAVVAAAPAIAAQGLQSVDVNQVMPGDRDYGFFWWADGWRERSRNGERIVCVRTGYYGMAFDVERLRPLHLGPIETKTPPEEAVAEDNAAVFNLPPAELTFEVKVGATLYRCVGIDPSVRDPLDYPVRLIESGRWVQRFDLQKLVFEDEKKNRLDADARLEIVAWPDALAFITQVTPRGDAAGKSAEVSLRLSGAGRSGSSSSSQVFRPGAAITNSLFQTFGAPTGKADVTAARLDGSAVPVTQEPTRGWHRVELPTESWDPATDLDHLERVRLTLKNPGENAAVSRLMFAKDESFAGVTGMTPMLRTLDGDPTGLPVQLSKNWHQTPGRTFLYQGPWFHGFLSLRLPPRSELSLEFALTYARWGGVPAASHAQLCLIGWGTNQRWDQAAIGSWGESITYDPDICLNRSMIDDVRPLMVWGMNQEKAKWTWTNNVGGGDFLVYENPAGKRQHLSRVRALYTSHGPNLTNVTYAGVSADGHIAARITVMTPRSDDINRAIHRLRYDVLARTPFKRLAFYQLGADHYNDHQFTTMARGSSSGLNEEWQPPKGGLRYSRSGIVCNGQSPWFSLHGAINSDKKGGAWANRGLIVRSWNARLGGRSVATPYAAVYGTENGPPSANVELTPPPDLVELQPGDFVEAEVELVITPISADDYYGPNENLRRALRDGGNTWKMIDREARGNALRVDVVRGQVAAHWPVAVTVDDRHEAEVVVHGGLGYVPVRFTGLPGFRGYELRRDDGNGFVTVDQSVHGRDYWQTDYDPVAKTWSLTYNVPLDSPEDRARPVRLALRKRD
jgi:hypothetical protein